jgi:hypothetical protein
MKEHPLLLSAPMVLAAIAGRKHVTRRILSKRNTLIDGKLWSQSKCSPYERGRHTQWEDLDFTNCKIHPDGLHIACKRVYAAHHHILTPIYQPGDAVWFKETWGIDCTCGSERESDFEHSAFCSHFRADITDSRAVESWKGKWKSSMFMPRKYSRLVRPITGSHIERVQDITEEQAEREGVAWFSTEGTSAEKTFVATKFPDGYRTNFMLLWDFLRPKAGQHWDDNPLVVAIEFGDEVRN